MGVPLLLTWLRNNFGKCVSYVAPRHTHWGRKRPADATANPAPLPPGARPRNNVNGARRTTAPHSFDNLYIDLNSLLYQSVTMVVERGVREAEASGQRAAHLATALSPSAAGAAGAGKAAPAAGAAATSAVGYETETKILAQLVVLLDELLTMTNPTSLIYIAVDGVSPKGKMSQQRMRRANTVKKGFHSKIKSLLGWDSNAITSGTLFMQRVTHVLHYYAVSRVERANGNGGVAVLGPNGSFADARLDTDAILDIALDRAEKAAIFRERDPMRIIAPGVTFVINDVRIAGEGEHKIIDAIRSFRDVKAVLELGGGGASSGSEQRTATAAGGPLEGVSIVTPKNSPLMGATFAPGGADGDAAAAPQQAEETVAPPYAVFQYNPNTTHCIVSPDTDVVVCALSLHEPHMTVYWYNSQDPEDSQFFNMLTFRDMLKGRLGFEESHYGDPERALFFEESLHDLIFILLLFGNDFLPKASALTDIGEGHLDRLLEFFVSDFVSRKRHLVDARTGRIDFAAARYIIDFAVNADFQMQVTTAKSTVASASEHDRKRYGNGGGPYGNKSYGNNQQQQQQPGGKAADEPFDPFAQGNDVVPGTTPKAGRPQLSEAEIASRCYDYWGGLQWAMLYCTGPCPSWSWQYYHTTVPSAEDLSRYCGMPDNLFDSCFVTTLAKPAATASSADGTDGAAVATSATDGNDGSGAAEGGISSSKFTQHYVGRADAAMDVIMQLVLLMPFGSRELLPLSIVDAYTRELAPLITDRPFEAIDLKFVMDWCERQKSRLAATDAQRLASFNTDRNPTIIRYQWPAHGIAARMAEGAAAAAAGSGNNKKAEEAAVVALLPTATTAPAAPAVSLDPFSFGGLGASMGMGGATSDPFGGSPFGGFALGGGGGVGAVASDDDLFGGLNNAAAKAAALEAATPTKMGPPSPAINPTASGHTPSRGSASAGGGGAAPAERSEWVRLAGPYHVPYPRSQLLLRVLQSQHQQYIGDEHSLTKASSTIQRLGGVLPAFTGLVTFFFDFKEDLHAPGMNTATSVYRCGDAAAEKACAPMVSLLSDWSRHRPCLLVGECREAAMADGEGGDAALLSHTMTNTISNANSATSGYLFRRTFLLPGVVQVPRGHAARKRPREATTADSGRPLTPQPATGAPPVVPPAPAAAVGTASPVVATAPSAAALAIEERKRQLALRLAASRAAQQ